MARRSSVRCRYPSATCSASELELRGEPSGEGAARKHREIIGLAALNVEEIAARKREAERTNELARHQHIHTGHPGVRAPVIAKLYTGDGLRGHGRGGERETVIANPIRGAGHGERRGPSC